MSSMSARKTKKARVARPCLTHFEVRRGDALRLRLAIADDALAGVGDELGALFKKIAPSAVAIRTVMPDVVSPGPISVVVPPPPAEFMVAPQHADNDAAYHAGLRERLANLFESLCDTSLNDALEIAREVHERRAESAN